MATTVSDGIWELMILYFIDNIVNFESSAKTSGGKSETSKSNKIKLCGFEIGSKLIDTIMI